MIKNWDLIVAHKNGADIQFKTINDWVDVQDPLWRNGVEYRVKPQPQLIPFDYGDAEQLIGRKVRLNNSKYMAIITSCTEVSVGMGSRVELFEILLRDYTFTDGTPCGKKNRATMMIEPRKQYKANGYQFQLQTYDMLPTTEAGTIRCKAIYADERDASDVNIEVLIMTLVPPMPQQTTTTEHFFGLPSKNSWGSKAWSFRDMTAAIRKFERI